MDFFQIAVTEKKGVLEAAPDFIVGRTEDLMVRAKNFYAIWDEDAGLWSTDEYDVQRIVDSRLKSFADENKHVGKVKYMRSFGAGGQTMFRKYMSQISDNAHQLDQRLTFKSQEVGKKDYVSKRLPYDLAPGDFSAWDELISTLYDPEQREKIEWLIGSIVCGESTINQKFFVFYGAPGSGKGTVIDQIIKLFDAYVTTFDAKALGSSSNQFATAAFASNPLVAIQHDGDLSRIEDNTMINMIVSHEIMKVNEKHKPAYDARFLAVLVMGTNKAVKITDAQSGLIRRLVDIHPSGRIVPPAKYHRLKDKINFQLGAIAYHCQEVYQTLGKNYYSNYRPLEMMFKTNAFVNFIQTYYDLFEKQDGVSAKQAWNLYKEYVEDANIQTKISNYAFRDELGKYFSKFHERYTLDGVTIRSYYTGFNAEPFKIPEDGDVTKFTLRMDETTSLFDLEFADYPAQYSKADGTPRQAWANVKTSLAEIDTTQEHYVNGFPENLIVIDFDLTGDDGGKSLERNLAAASNWPATYGELSKSGKAVHLHYYWTGGDVSELDSNYADGIEIKVYTGNSALRRRLTRCNDVAIAELNGGLPFKEKKRVLEPGTMKSAKALRALIVRNLKKEIHPGTKPSIDFIKHILDEAYQDGLKFDVSDMRQQITAFANYSTNQPLACLKVVQEMRWKSEEDAPVVEVEPQDERLVIYDVETYPNLFVICWKFKSPDGETPDAKDVVRMINPKPHEVEALFRFKLVGFNVKNYDNHMIWAAAMGFNNEQLYHLSKNIIDGKIGAKFGQAYKLSHADIYDFSTKKQSLKKWQIELGLTHKEMEHTDFDKPVPDDQVMVIVDYCANDVVSTEEVLDHLDGDYKARLLLADLSGLEVNASTAQHTAKIIFGNEKNPQRNFVYTDLSKEFPGYVFEAGKSTYRGYDVGEGGFVFGLTGLHRDVGLLDIASMHPTTIGQLNLFGDYTSRYMELVAAQLVVKNLLKTRDFHAAKALLDGKLRPYIEEIEKRDSIDPEAAKKYAAELRHGLKIAMNIVYGLTSAKFDNPFRDFRNKDNIVAKRGALFMIDLMEALRERGTVLMHTKTDSVKISNITKDDIDFVMNFGNKYGYTFEEEAIYSKLALFNDAVYIAKKNGCDISAHSTFDPKTSCWTATGTQFIPEANPYVFKRLFGYSDDISLNDMGITRSVKEGAIYLDFGIHNANVETIDGDADMGYMDRAIESLRYAEKELKKTEKALKAAGKELVFQNGEDLQQHLQDAHDAYAEALTKLVHVGRVGRFVPVLPGNGGGQLWRVKDGKHYAIAGTKGYLWVTNDVAMDLPDDALGYSYFDRLVEEAKIDINVLIENHNYGGFASVEDFLS